MLLNLGNPIFDEIEEENEITEWKYLTVLVNCLTFDKKSNRAFSPKSIYCATAEILGLAMKQEEEGYYHSQENALQTLVKEKVKLTFPAFF